LGDAINRNFERWPILDQYVWPNPYIGYTYDNELDYLKTWLTDRLTWLDIQWLTPLNTESFETTPDNFNIFPNPFQTSFNLTVSPLNLEDIVIDIFAIQGQKLVTRIFKPTTGLSEEFIIDNINIPSGIYFLHVYQSGQLLGSMKIICSGEK